MSSSSLFPFYAWFELIFLFWSLWLFHLSISLGISIDMHASLHKSRRENHRRVVFTQQETIYSRTHLLLTNLLITSLLVLCFSWWFVLFLPPFYFIFYFKYVPKCYNYFWLIFLLKQNKGSKKEDRLKSFIERKQRWWAHLYLNSKCQNRSLGWHEIKRIFGGRNKRNHREKHRTNKLVISKLVSTRCVRK